MANTTDVNHGRKERDIQFLKRSGGPIQEVSRLGVKFWVEYIQTEPGVIRYLYLRQEDEKQQEEETKNEWEKTKDYVANALVITGFIAAAGGGLVYYTADICDSILNKYH